MTNYFATAMAAISAWRQMDYAKPEDHKVIIEFPTEVARQFAYDRLGESVGMRPAHPYAGPFQYMGLAVEFRVRQVCPTCRRAH